MSQISFDTSTSCLFLSAKTLSGEIISRSFAGEFDMSAELIGKINDLYTEILAKDSSDKLSALNITLGPGSFTGLRVGMSTIKGISAALNIPVYGFPTLKTYALSLVSSDKFKGSRDNSLIIPILDARKSRYYSQIFRFSASSDCVELSPALDILLDDLIQTIKQFNPINVFFVKGYATVVSLHSDIGFNYKEFDILSLNNPATILLNQQCDILKDEQGPLYVREVDAVEYKRSSKLSF